MKINPKLFFALFALIGLNILSGGFVEEQLDSAINGEQGQFVLEGSMCLAGLALYNPIWNVGGIDVPAPSLLNVSIALVISAVVIFLIEIRYDLRYRDYLKIILGIWILLKITGWWLVNNSIEGCGDLVGEDVGLISIISLVFVPLIILEYLMGRKS